MKRIAGLLIGLIFVVGVVGYGGRQVAVLREHSLRQHQREAMLAGLEPLALDATTKAVLAGADRVETFRLAGGDHDDAINSTPAEEKDLLRRHVTDMDDHGVLRTGAPQGKAFAAALSAALSSAKSQADMMQCFDPVVGFRVWKGKAHTDLCVCFFCSGVEVITENARHEEVFHQRVEMGESRPAFLTLAKRAFPRDSEISALKESDGSERN